MGCLGSAADRRAGGIEVPACQVMGSQVQDGITTAKGVLLDSTACLPAKRTRVSLSWIPQYSHAVGSIVGELVLCSFVAYRFLQQLYNAIMPRHGGRCLEATAAVSFQGSMHAPSGCGVQHPLCTWATCGLAIGAISTELCEKILVAELACVGKNSRQHVT